MNKEQKAAVVEELSKELSDSGAVFAIDYRGISVPQAAELREGLREADTRFQVVKNRLTLLAAEKAGTEAIKEHLEGPTALALVKGDPALAAKTIFRLGREWEVLEYKGGLMEGEVLDADTFGEIARLPGRDQMNAQFAGIVASPLTGLVRGLGSMVQGLALQLQAIADQGLVTGEAPAEPTEKTPAGEEEAPKDVDAPAGDAAEEASADEGGGSEDASSDGEAEAPTPEASEESKPDPDPEQSPEEEPSEEEAPADEDAGEDAKAEETTEGDAEIGEAAEEAQDGEETSEDSNEKKEDDD